jgi:hypothetical protein
MIHRRAFVTGLAAVPVAGRAFAACATPRLPVAPVRANRTGLIYDYYYVPNDAEDCSLVYSIRQNSNWHYHTFFDDHNGVIRHVATGLTFVTVLDGVELLDLGSDLRVDSSRLKIIGYATQTAAFDGLIGTGKEHRQRMPHAQQALYFRVLDQEPDEDDEDPQWTIRQPAPPLLATEGDTFEDIWIYPHSRA